MHVKQELTGRLKLGLKKYNQGVRVSDNTMHWGTERNSWLDMAKEEFLDAIIYIIADYIRTVRSNGILAPLSFRRRDEIDDNKLIMTIFDDWGEVQSPHHKMLLWNLLNMLNSELFCSQSSPALPVV
jgi:hypothetical protein